ncbi:MAG TPA: alanine--glyoxylate aminotransferase family protein [Conexivisphaerales archaeon]|nr:alanine--glyoxylate aminotransferase family protein [Conexivisphaerales archaeon]
MADPTLVMVPGPTNLHPRVLQVMSLPMIAHTSKEFENEFLQILDLTRYAFQTKGDVVVFTGSGTFGIESSAASLLERGDKVLSIELGYFGKRYTHVSKIYGAETTVYAPPEGQGADPKVLDEMLSKERFKAVFITHVETSMGVINRVKELAAVARRHGALAMVDAVCGLGGAELRFDDWDLDVAFAGSQKAIAAPPGAMLMALSARALEAMQARKTSVPSYYFNLQNWMTVMRDPHIYLTTPSVPVLRALRVALEMVMEEGLEARWRRHAALSSAFREALLAGGSKLWARDPSPTVTAIQVKEAQRIQSAILADHNVLVARGIDLHRDDMIRVGHMGNVTKEQLIVTLAAFGEAVHKELPSFDAGSAVSEFLKRTLA